MAGLDIMDSHRVDDAVVWHHLPNWNGLGGMYLLPALLRESLVGNKEANCDARLRGIASTYRCRLLER